MSKKILTVAFTLTLMFVGAASAGALDREAASAEAHFKDGVNAYETGDYDTAIARNEKALETGRASGEIYYNLGNAYLKKGAAGKAILNYERAREFIPRDSALRVNYRLALASRKQRDAAGAVNPFILELYRTFDYLTLRESAFLFILLAYLFAAFFALSKFARRFRPLHLLTALLLLALTLATAIPLSRKIRDAERALIITAPITDAKLEPADDAATNFPLYDGMKVYRLTARKGWLKIKRPDGKIGWVKEGSVASITP